MRKGESVARKGAFFPQRMDAGPSSATSANTHELSNKNSLLKRDDELRHSFVSVDCSLASSVAARAEGLRFRLDANDVFFISFG